MTEQNTTLPSVPARPSAEFAAFLAVLREVAPDAPTACPGWTAHDLLTHLVAGAQEISRLVEEALAGRAVPPTRGFEEREAPLRALPDGELRGLLLAEGARLGQALAALRAVGPTRVVPFTGWAMTADELQTHLRSELAVHRWDLVGADVTGEALLAQPDLFEHALAVRQQMTGLAESARPLPGDLESLAPADRLLAAWGRPPARRAH